MLGQSQAFSGYSVDDVDAARDFYGGTLGLDVADDMGGLGLRLGTGCTVFLYPKPNHEPATFTVLNFPVDDIEATVEALRDAGITTERYDGFEQDERGIASTGDGPRIAWFKDPAGNILSVLQG